MGGQLGAGRVRAQAKSSTSLTGRVLNPASAGVVGYRVEAFDSDGNFMADALTGPRGVYSMANMQLGPYQIIEGVAGSGAHGSMGSGVVGWRGGVHASQGCDVVPGARPRGFPPSAVGVHHRHRNTGTVAGGEGDDSPMRRVVPGLCADDDGCEGTLLIHRRASASWSSFTMFDQRRHSSLPLVARGAVPKIVPGRGIRIDLNVPAVLRGKKVTR